MRARSNWDWKYGALKKLSARHAQTMGWSAERDAGPPAPGALFFVVADIPGRPHVMWGNALPRLPELDEAAAWYLGYAHNDILDCVKWQLAERTSDTTSNPFVPLVRCYAAGAYPFSLDREHVVLFRFAPATPPRATASRRGRRRA